MSTAAAAAAEAGAGAGAADAAAEQEMQAQVAAQAMMTTRMLDRIWRYPATSFLLYSTCIATVIYSLLTITDPAIMLVVGARDPIRIALMRSSLFFSSTSLKGEMGCPWSDESFHAVLMDCVVWVLRFIGGNWIVSTPGELLFVCTALATFAGTMERCLRLSGFCLLILFSGILRTVWCAVSALLWSAFFTETEGNCYRLRPGPAWLCVMLYVCDAMRASRSRRHRKQHYHCDSEIGGNTERGPAAAAAAAVAGSSTRNDYDVGVDESSLGCDDAGGYSRLRLFGKIPLGAGLLYTVIALALAARMDVWMELVPAVLAALLLGSEAAVRKLRATSVLPRGMAGWISRHRASSGSNSSSSSSGGDGAD